MQLTTSPSRTAPIPVTPIGLATMSATTQGKARVGTRATFQLLLRPTSLTTSGDMTECDKPTTGPVLESHSTLIEYLLLDSILRLLSIHVVAYLSPQIHPKCKSKIRNFGNKMAIRHVTIEDKMTNCHVVGTITGKMAILRVTI